eukprot:2251171-Alexandrium_andersonii.AAC.1
MDWLGTLVVPLCRTLWVAVCAATIAIERATARGSACDLTWRSARLYRWLSRWLRAGPSQWLSTRRCASLSSASRAWLSESFLQAYTDDYVR